MLADLIVAYPAELEQLVVKLKMDVASKAAALGHRQEPEFLPGRRVGPFFFSRRSEKPVSAASAPSAPASIDFVTSDQPRLALVIGNGDYNQNGALTDGRESAAVREQGFAPDLPNAPNDAHDIAAALRRMGFETTLAIDVSYQQMLEALFEFERLVLAARPDAIVIIYYAGHALQVGGGNYLVPVGAKFPGVDFNRMTDQQAELMLSQYALPLQTSLLGRLRNPRGRGLNLVILDACRENPFEQRRVGREVIGHDGRSRSRGLAGR